MIHHGFVRVAAATPELRVADCAFNAVRVVAKLRHAQAEGVAVALFPELCLTGYTCADLFQHPALLQGARDALTAVAAATASASPASPSAASPRPWTTPASTAAPSLPRQ